MSSTTSWHILGSPKPWRNPCSNLYRPLLVTEISRLRIRLW
jgi:lipopolysaccharide biosynthesis glycosyltransferase